MIIDCLHTENAEDTEVRKRTLWGKRLSINDDWLMINDFVHTENADDAEVRKRTMVGNSNCQKLDSN